ncbi:hypothetical protein M3484_18845 [Pseudomonas sp. GX19020]|uniref:hypothetical protein n=1 Tax=Pseudomonas sp. GX19020 TaxID=2942277 RepID=UPI002018485E|nr:hypothetical protein [Pseudomonas sp. GX19020]MCL4068627.1 hypothetical protein [Pseudomonas sp. GX19020]
MVEIDLISTTNSLLREYFPWPEFEFYPFQGISPVLSLLHVYIENRNSVYFTRGDTWNCAREIRPPLPDLIWITACGLEATANQRAFILRATGEDPDSSIGQFKRDTEA